MLVGDDRDGSSRSIDVSCSRATPAGGRRVFPGIAAPVGGGPAPSSARRGVGRGAGAGAPLVAGPQAADVGEPGEAEHEGQEEEAAAPGQHVEQRDRDQRAGAPRELEPRLEPGERAPAQVLGTVALQQAVERDATGRGTDRDRERDRDRADPPAVARREQRDDRRDHERRRRGSSPP